MAILGILLILLAGVLLGLSIRIATMDKNEWNKARRLLKIKHRTHEQEKELTRSLEQWRDSLD
jgi:hypothetical protein